MKYIIIGSNVIDGLTFWGPFDTTTEAMHYAEAQGHDFGPWNIAGVNPATDGDAE